MEYCEQKTLKNMIDRGMSVDESWRIFRQLLEGLAHIHDKGVIHRDLKPTNIFLDAQGGIKIGDFGLSTRLDADVKNLSRDPSYSGDPSTSDNDMTSRIGTSFYIAPEILTQGVTKYDQKVDLYSSGVIFFEMFHAFSTGMERALVLTNLRKPEMQLPSGFDQVKFRAQTRLLKLLLDHDPKVRPSAREVLTGDYLPAKIEDESIVETMRVITAPGNIHFRRLMSQLFTRPFDAAHDFTFEFNATSRYAESFALARLQVSHCFRRAFETHAAIEINTPLLMPHRRDMHASCQLLDGHGVVVDLPHNLTSPFARWVSRQNLSRIRRYAIAAVYRENTAGGQPRVFYEADFDIVHDGVIALHDAEVIMAALDGFGKGHIWFENSLYRSTTCHQGIRRTC
jgi:translation initiation factor 2-alpha kinase 4